MVGDDFLRIRILCDFGAGFIGFGYFVAGDIVVLGHQTHFGLAEDEGGISVVSAPLSGGEAAHDGGELVDHLADRAKVGLANEAIKQVCFEFRPHHFGDGDHCCRGRHDGVGAVKKILTMSASHCKTIDVVDKDVVN